MPEGRGGRRKGAGRPPTAFPLKTLTVRLTAEQIAWLNARGNASAALRELVQAAMDAYVRTR